MSTKKRYSPKKPNSLRGTGYDSMFEKRLHETILKGAKFHDKNEYVDYIVTHTYQPDFIVEKDGKKFLVEAKARFRDGAEARKYTFIREVLNETTELVFVLEKHNTKFPFARRRKNGTTMDHEEWLTKQEFRFWHQDTFNVDLL